jgi:GntR family transcriptional regulator, rspAB operon transcriptional repressor
VARAGSSRLLAPPAGEAASLADRAFYEIRALIVSLELAPGSVISERDLVERLEIGRTPVREALRRLAQEKLVEVYPRRGMFVTAVDVRDLARLCEVRAVLEPEAARLAAERATELDLDVLDRLIDELMNSGPRNDRALIELDARIHKTIYRCTHNHFLEATLEEYYALALRIWMLALEETGELQAAVLEHHDLLETIAQRHGEVAAQMMRDHVEHFEAAMRRVLLAR